MCLTKSLINKVNLFIKNQELFSPNDQCLLGISGGFDSTVLLDIFSKIKQLFKIKDFAIAHINYNLRGEDSLKDQLFVENLAQKYNIKIFSLDINLNSYISENNIKDSLENIARKIRYDFFKEIAKNNDFNKLVLAHNANDHAETIILKLIRGTVTGLKGIETKRKFNNIEIVRPLLCLSRKEIENYSMISNLNPRTDLSNNQDDYTRNRIRNNFLPFIINENPNFLESIYNSSQILNREDKYLDNLAINLIDSCLIKTSENQIVLSYEKLILNDQILINRVIKNVFFRLKNDTQSFSYKHIEAIKNNIKDNISKKIIELPNNYFFLKDRNYLIFSKGEISLVPEEFLYNFTSVNLKEIIKIDKLNISIELKESDNSIRPDKNNLAFIVNKIENITVKNYNESEVFISFGKNNPTTLKEVMDKNKVPELVRKNLLMIYINNLFLGIPGYIRSNNFLFNQTKQDLKSYFFIVKP